MVTRRQLARLAGAVLSGESVAEDCLPASKQDWTALGEQADRQGIAGALGSPTAQGRLKPVAPGEFCQHVRRAYLRQWQRNGLLCREIERIARHLDGAGLPHLVYKGPLLALRLYGCIGSREVHDIDLLIPEDADYPRYHEAFLQLGYRCRSLVVFPRRLTRSWLNQLEYSRQGLNLEPHWSLQRHASLRLDAARAWREATAQQTPGGMSVRTLSLEYTLLAIMLALPSDLNNGSLRLRSLLDLYLLFRALGAAQDWAAFWERRREEHTLRLVATALGSLQQLFGPLAAPADALPPGAADETLSRNLVVAALGQPAGAWQGRRLAWQLFESTFSRSLLWWSKTLPARALAHPGVSWSRLRRLGK